MTQDIAGVVLTYLAYILAEFLLGQAVFGLLLKLQQTICPAISTGRFEQQTPSRALGRTRVRLQLIIKPVFPLGTVANPVLGSVGRTSASPEVSKV